MRKHSAILLLLLSSITLHAQNTPNVLFVGNSYIYTNNLPQMVSDITTNMGDRMTYSANTPGGCTFMQHCSNQSMTMIQQGSWDIVVLQEQSQLPSFRQWEVEQQCFPYAQRLVDSIYANNPNAEPMFYMTWGRKYGDADNARIFPVLSTYEGMDSMLYERYTYMAEAYHASLCPVGRVWRHLRTNHPEIELYASDGSHPSMAGTYAAACSFYVMFFHRDPDSISFSATLDEQKARIIRNTVKTVVFDSLAFWRHNYPLCGIDTQKRQTTLTFYPNPASSFLTVKTATEIQYFSIEYINGRTISTQHPSTKEFQIDIRQLLPGIYVIKALTNTGVISRPFIKQP